MTIQRLGAAVVSLVALSISVSALASGQDLEIHASLSGYNLIAPTRRCCAFDMHLAADGTETIIATFPGVQPHQESQTVHLSIAQMRQIREKIRQIDFFALPKNIGLVPVDADDRLLMVAEGGKSNQVSFFEESAIDEPASVREQLARVMSLWSVLMSTFEIPGQNVK